MGAGTDPWAVIFMIAFMPYMRGPDPTIAYQAARKAPSFPLPLLWIPVLIFLAIQFFGGYRDYRYDQYGRLYPELACIQKHLTAPVADTATACILIEGLVSVQECMVVLMVGREWLLRGAGLGHRLRDGDSYNRYNVNNNQSWLWTTFMEYGGHWMLIVLGIALFALVGSSSVQAAPGYASRSPLSFPWSLFAPRGPRSLSPLM